MSVIKQKQVQKMTEDFDKRILVVLDRNYLNNRSEEEYNNIHNIRYYDMYAKGWRSFKPNNLTTIYQVIETPKSDNQNNQNDN